MSDNKQYTLKELKEKLTDKELIFCHEYIVDWNGARAARKAGYEQNRDRQTAYDLVTKSYIKQYIDFIKDDIAQEAGLSKLMIILEQKKIAFSSIANLHETWIKRHEFEDLEQEQRDCIQEIETKIRTEYEFNSESNKREPISVEYVKIKLYDKQKALDSITKMMGWNEPDKLNIESPMGSMSPKINIDLSELTDKELEIYEKIQSKIERKK